MGSLPELLLNYEKDFQGIIWPKLEIDEDQVNKFRLEIQAKKNFIIGISWKTKAKQRSYQANIELHEFMKIFSNYDVSIINLQHGDVEEEINQLELKNNIDFINYKKIDNFNDIDGLASLIDMCDLIITIDNVTAHLSSALGKETWVLLPLNSDYRWGLNSEKSCYYEKARLFRNKTLNDWADVLKNVENNLEIKFKQGDSYEST